jgi:hypothetical protein
MTETLIVLLIISIQLNAFLYFKYKKSIKSPVPTKDAQALLSELAGGRAILKIDVINPEDIFLRSPRS